MKVGDRVSYIVKVGAGYPAVCADTDENSILEFTGYICRDDGQNKTVMWDTMSNTNPSSRCGSGRKTWSKKDKSDDIAWISQYLGFCGITPTYFNNTVKSVVEASSLNLVHSCKSTSDCDGAGCNMQNLVYIHYPTTGYSVAKDQVNDILSKARDVYTSTQLATQNDIQYLVDIGMPYCSCGWINKDGKITSVYPSTSTSGSGCGSGQTNVINCGDNGPSWSGGKAGVYVMINGDPTTIPKLLGNAGITGTIVITLGKNEYESITGGFKPGLKILNPNNYVMYGPYIGRRGNASIVVEKIIIDGNDYLFMLKDSQWTKIVRTDANIGNQKGFYYQGEVNQYGTIALRTQVDRKYNIKLK
jgi:hypothetical protein